MNTINFSWPEGKSGALTSSWDDGVASDRRLVELFNKKGLKGSFYLSSAHIGKTEAQSGWKDYVTAEEMPTLYQGHEVGSHTVHHPYLWKLPLEAARWEMVEDRRKLEEIMGCPIRGFVFPFGRGIGNIHLSTLARDCGFRYARLSTAAEGFELPGDFLSWHVTTHCRGKTDELWKKFVAHHHTDKLFYMWGHSYEFDDHQAWDSIETFAEMAAATPGIWHATNRDIYAYVSAWRSLVCSVDMTSFSNTGGKTVWFTCKDKLYSIAPGETLRVA